MDLKSGWCWPEEWVLDLKSGYGPEEWVVDDNPEAIVWFASILARHSEKSTFLPEEWVNCLKSGSKMHLLSVHVCPYKVIIRSVIYENFLGVLTVWRKPGNLGLVPSSLGHLRLSPFCLKSGLKSGYSA